MHRQTTLSHGVTVTLQILVLSFQVRILVAQREGSKFASLFSFCESSCIVRLAKNRAPSAAASSAGPFAARPRPAFANPAPPLHAERIFPRSGLFSGHRHETARSVPPNHSLLPRPERRTEARGASNRISASLRHARNENAEPADAPVVRPDAPPAPQQKPARAVKRPRKIEVRPFEKPCGTGRTFRAPDRWFRVIRRPAAFEVLRSRAKPHADRHPQQKSMRLSDCRPPPKGRQPAVGIAGRHRASGGERAIPAGPASADRPKTNGASCRPAALRGDSLQAVIRRHRPDRQ